jgi:hypothetical protein
MATTPSITKEMRLYTREIHKISDDLVNAKLAFGELKKKIIPHTFSLIVFLFSLEQLVSLGRWPLGLLRDL